MQTQEENLKELIESLKISNAYRRQQENLWRLQGGHAYMSLLEEDPAKVVNFH